MKEITPLGHKPDSRFFSPERELELVITEVELTRPVAIVASEAFEIGERLPEAVSVALCSAGVCDRRGLWRLTFLDLAK